MGDAMAVVCGCRRWGDRGVSARRLDKWIGHGSAPDTAYGYRRLTDSEDSAESDRCVASQLQDQKQGFPWGVAAL